MARAPRIGFGIANLAVAALVGVSVFRGLPSRWWVVDSGAVVVVAALAISGVALLVDARVAAQVTRIASALVLALGFAVGLALTTAASFLSGVYGSLGRGGSMIFILVVALVLPYLVILPAVELLWVGPRRRAS